MKIRDAAPLAAAIVLAGALGTGIVALIASGEPASTAQPAPGPTAVVTTTEEPAPGTDRLTPQCFETSTAGAQDCAWIPVAPCESDEAGDDAIPNGYDGCYWDAQDRGNRAGSSYVIWRGGRG